MGPPGPGFLTRCPEAYTTTDITDTPCLIEGMGIILTD